MTFGKKMLRPPRAEAARKGRARLRGEIAQPPGAAPAELPTMLVGHGATGGPTLFRALSHLQLPRGKSPLAPEGGETERKAGSPAGGGL
jgi:hypothetical protein